MQKRSRSLATTTVRLLVALGLTTTLIACGDDGNGSSAPTPTPTAIPTATPTTILTATPTSTPTPTATVDNSGGSACAGPNGRCIELGPSDNDQEQVLAALIDAQPGDVIFLHAGTYHLTGQLSLDVDNVTVRGEGMDRTILSFKDQSAGGEGFLVTANHFMIEDIGLEDSQGDLLKVLGADGLTIRRVRAEWTNGPDADNGAYGLYPVECTNVVIEDSVVKGASDAGIYVGQSHNIIVRRNRPEFNVAGIEIENSTDADVYENVVTHNTGGILVFNLPGLQVKDGQRTRIFNNDSVENNTPNFAPPGNTVGAVPAGTGAMIMANDGVEIFNNRFRDNATTHILSISFRTAAQVGDFRNNDPLYDPYSETIFIHDNTYVGGGDNPGGAAGTLLKLIIGGLPLPNIIIDGDANAARLVDGQIPAELRTCIQEGDITFANIDFGHAGRGFTRELTAHDCRHTALNPVVIPGSDVPPPTPAPTRGVPTPTPTPNGTMGEMRCPIPAGTDVNFDPAAPSCELLSSYRLFVGTGIQEPNSGVLPYDLNTPLFSDYASKHRFVWLPPGTSARYDGQESFDFPVGTVIVKTFAYPRDVRDPSLGEQLIETRLLVHREHGWVGLPYQWNAAQTEARLKVVGADQPVSWIHGDGATREIAYHVPNANQCKECHDEHGGVFSPLGPKARNLNRDFAYADGTENQLTHWTRVGYLTGAPAPSEAPRTAVFDDPSSGTLEQRARGYLDVNCGSCHNPSGLARTTGLYLGIQETNPAQLGVCKSPVAAGRGSGGFHFDIQPGDPDSSILLFRMKSIEGGIAMPELGRQTVHDEAIQVISDWIASLEGTCEQE